MIRPSTDSSTRGSARVVSDHGRRLAERAPEGSWRSTRGGRRSISPGASGRSLDVAKGALAAGAFRLRAAEGPLPAFVKTNSCDNVVPRCIAAEVVRSGCRSSTTRRLRSALTSGPACDGTRIGLVAVHGWREQRRLRPHRPRSRRERRLSPAPTTRDDDGPGGSSFMVEALVPKALVAQVGKNDRNLILHRQP